MAKCTFCGKDIQKGTSIHKSFESYGKLYPVLISQMIEVGEESGNLVDNLDHLAEFYQEEIDQVTKNLSVIIEPVLMVIIGSAVGFFAVSMLQPMYSILQNV